MQKLLVATTNAGKVREYAALLAQLPVEIVGVKDVGLQDLDVEENADTFEGNAEIKARAYGDASGILTIADDSGLVVDALDGRPGIYSARYGGTGNTDISRYEIVLKEMENITDDARTARFACSIALYDPQSGRFATAYDTVEGHIAREAGENTTGFGYDPIFVPQGYDIPISAMTAELKNQLSHRGRATQQILPVLRQWLNADQ